jgi:hypothetical protein
MGAAGRAAEARLGFQEAGVQQLGVQMRQTLESKEPADRSTGSLRLAV